MIQRVPKLLLFLQLFVAVIISLPVSAPGAEIKIKPGKFDHFNISMPEKIIAGEDATINLLAVDSFNNPITNFGDTLREFNVQVSGSATVNNPAVKSSSFINGAIAVVMMDKAAETVNLSIRETGSPIPVLSKDINILPNKLNSFVLKGPRVVMAGDRFDVKITAMDTYGNTVLDHIPGKNLNLIFKGEADPKIDMPSIPDFKGGTCYVRLVSDKTGIMTVEAKDLITGGSGTSDKIEIVNGPVNSFRVFAPKEVVAGEPFEVSIVAIDQFNNVVSNYASTGNGIVIASSGKMKPFPSTIPAYEFINGQAKADLRYDAVDDIALIVTEAGKNHTGRTNLIKFVPPVPTRYEVTTPESALAGQKFKIKITVYSQLGHVIRNYNIVGPDVQLSTTGSGVLIPNRIPASEFTNGTAVVEVQYNKSEDFTITASPVRAVSGPAAKTATAVKTSGKSQIKAAPSAKQEKKSKKAKAKEGTKKAETKTESTSNEITDVSLLGSKKKSTIDIRIPGLNEAVKYNAYSEKSKGKKWIVLKVKSAVNKVDKPLKFDSAYVGNIVVEEDKKEKDTVLVKIEQLKPSRFHVTKEKDGLSVTLKH